MSLTTAALVVAACAMCASPDGTTAIVPAPVISVHDVDPTRTAEACYTIGAIVGTTHCVQLPPIPGLDPAATGPVYTIYTTDRPGAESARVAVNSAYGGRAVSSVQDPTEAPACPCVSFPAGRMHAAV